MSMGGFAQHLLLGLHPNSQLSTVRVSPEQSSKSPTQSNHHSPTSASNDDSLALNHSQILPENIYPSFDYAAAIQLMQLQMLCQPSLFSLFQNVTQKALVNSLKVKEIANVQKNELIREKKRAPSRTRDEVPAKKNKSVKRVIDDTETSSPVSGMYIKEASSLPPAEQLQAAADLDDTAAFVNVSEESRRNIARISNIIGDCICALCKVKYDDVFRLAQHRCPRIIHEEYRCPECEKVFSCPANLASHRRWHKPKNYSETFECTSCSASFDSRKSLKAHSTHCCSKNTTSAIERILKI